MEFYSADEYTVGRPEGSVLGRNHHGENLPIWFLRADHDLMMT